MIGGQKGDLFLQPRDDLTGGIEEMCECNSNGVYAI